MEAEESFTFSSYYDITNKLKSGELLLCEKPKRGKIWRLFSRITNREGEELDFVYCRNCEKVCRFKPTQSSNLSRHNCYTEKSENSEHEVSILEEEKPKIQFVDVSVNNLTQLFTKWIIQNCCSSDSVQSEGLKAIFKEILSLGAKFGIGVDISKLSPSLPEVSQNISNVYKYFFDLVKVDISSVKESGFGLAAGIWTDNLTEESCIAVTVHYCKDGVLSHRLLGFQLLEIDFITIAVMRSPGIKRPCVSAIHTNPMPSSHGVRNNEDVARKLASGEFVLSERYGRSKVWHIFSRILNQKGEEQEYAWCRSCEKIYKRSLNQTSNLCKHSCFVKRFVNAEHEVSILEEEKPKIQFVEVPVNNLTLLLTKWILQNCVSFDVIQSEDLKAVFMELLKLGAKFGNDVDLGKLLPSLSELVANISDVYNYFFESIKADISSAKENGFGLAADIWTDSLTEESYIAVTVHYCKDGMLTLRLLGFQLLEVDFIANQDIGETVQSILGKFDCQLSNKCIIVTNGATDTSKTLPDTKTLPCMSHILNNVLLKSMEKVPKVLEVINSCSKMLNFLKKNAPSTLLSKLTYKSHNNRCLAIHKLLDSVLTNWDEVEQFLKDKNELQNFAISKNQLQALESVLQSFKEAIETLEDDSYATLHLVMAYMRELRKLCQTTVDEYNNVSFVKSLRENIRLHLEDAVVKHINILHKIAVFLYPPTNKLLPYSDEEKQSIEDECMRLLKQYKVEAKPAIKQEPGEQQPLNSAHKRRKLLADFLESETHYDSNEIIRQELQNYKNTRVVLSDDFNVFNWWEVQKDNFPLLYRLSCTVLATPATNAASKRVLSKAKCLLSERVRQDSSETDIESIMFINTNATGVGLDEYFAV